MCKCQCNKSDLPAEGRSFNEVVKILKKHDYDEHKLIPILQEVQEEYRYLPRSVLNFIATALKVPASRIYGVATFYGHFALEPKGKYVVKICNGTACHVKGSMKIYDAIKNRLGLGENEGTTPDMLFTVETVSCLGACGLAPVMLINDKVYGSLTAEKSVSALEEVLKAEGGKDE